MSRNCFTTPTNPCPSYPDTKCIVYTGVNLTCTSIRTNDRLDAILLKIDTKLCTLSGGTTYIIDGDGINITGAGTSGNPYKPNITDPYTDEKAQDAVGGILSNEFSYNDNTPLISINQIDWSKIVNVPPSAAVNIYTSDGTIEENRTVDLDNKTITWDNNNLFFIRDDSANVGEYRFSNGLLFENSNSTDSYEITQNLTNGVKIGWHNIPNTSVINLNILSTGIYANGLTNLTSQNRLIGQDGVTNELGFVTISGPDLTLSGGLLSFTGNTNYIKNQFVGAQSSANFWVDGNSRVDGYTQIGNVGRIVDDIGTLSFVTPTSLDVGTNIRIKRLLFYRDGQPDTNSASQIYASGSDRLDFVTTSLIFYTPNWWAQQDIRFHLGNARPFVIGGNTTGSSAISDDIISVYNAGEDGIAGTGTLSLIGYAGNITTTGRVTLARAGSETIDYGTSTYKGDFLIYTANATAPAERVRVRYDGNVYIKTLDTDLVAPTTIGTTKMVICDSAGLLSSIDIPGAGAGTVTSFSAGDLSPLFTTAEATTTTTPALTFSLNSQLANTGFYGPISGGSASPTFRAMVAEDVAANSGHYIQNQTGSQTANFFVSGYSSVGTSPISTRKFSVGESALAIADADRRVLDISFGATFNTTASAISSYSVNATNTSSRTSGSNALTNIGLYTSATTGQVNYSAYFDAGDILMASLANTSSQNRIVGQDSATNIIDYVTIGSGLSLSAGVLSATSSGAQNLQSVLTTGSTLTGNNTINAGGFNFELSSAANLTFGNTGTFFLKVASFGSATVGDVLTLQSTSTGAVAWAANGAGTGGTVTSFSAGDLAPLFTTSEATVTSTPALSFALTNAAANTYFGNSTGSTAAPSYTTAGSLTGVNDTNVTLTLGGNPTTSLLRSASLTLGWTGTLAVVRGGTGLSSVGTANQLIRTNSGATAFEHFTPTYISANQTITLSGDVTGSGTTAITTTIANDAVTNAKMANIVASRFKGRITASTGDPEDMTGTQATTLLDVFTSGLKGVAPASGGGTTNFLRADGTWTTPGGGGTVTSIDITAPSAGITATGGPITTTGSITLALANDLAAVEGLTTTGIVRRTGTSTWTAGGVVTIAEGGTALTSTPTNGQFLIGNGTGYTLATLTGTANQITVTSGAGSSALSLPQNIHTSATPQFTRIGLGTAASTAYGANIGGSGHTIAALGVVASTSAQTNSDAYVALIAGTIVEAASGTHSMLSALALSPAIITPGAATVTRTATLYVSGASSATVTVANDAIYSASGNNRFAGDIIAGANNVNSTNNYDVVVRNQSTGRIETVASDVVAINAQTGATYILVLTDKGKIVDRDNALANTTTIPLNSSVAYPIGTQILIRQKGVGQTTITPTGGVTLQGADGAFKTRVQHSAATIVKMATDIWWASGDLTT